MSVDEMIHLQGFELADVPYKEAGLSKSAAAAALGNGQTFTLLTDLLPYALFHASLITLSEFRAMHA